MRRKVWTYAIVFLLSSTLLAGALGGYYLNLPAQKLSKEYQFTIFTGESVASITSRLHKEGIIRSSLFLRALSRVTGGDTKFPHGTFLLNPSESTYMNYQRLLSNNEVLQRVTIPEGWTVRKIARKLQEQGIIEDAENFIRASQNTDVFARYGFSDIRSAEGFLFPDTYFLPLNARPEFVIDHMVANFFSQVKGLGVQYEYMNSNQFYSTVILSSIVEREYVAGHEAPLIASVFLNRLEDNMRLQSCATVVYVITEEYLEEHPGRLYYRDLKRESGYNTYLHKGLPPGPISNAGAIALRSSFFPAESDYYFFVLRGYDADDHYFSRSASEHFDAALLYLKKES